MKTHPAVSLTLTMTDEAMTEDADRLLDRFKDDPTGEIKASYLICRILLAFGPALTLFPAIAAWVENGQPGSAEAHERHRKMAQEL